MKRRDETASTRPLGGDGDRREAPVPPMLGRFVITGSLGAGGMGIVLSAIDPMLERAVAIKLLRPDSWQSSEGRDRLQREAQAMARIAHPNVVHVYEIGAADEHIFIVMELIAGETLKDWLRQQPRSVDEILTAFIDVGRGLDAAHHAGLIHRDVKPSNILVGRDGRARIGDFGLVSGSSATATKRQGADDATTRTSGVVGTIGYMSPEHFAYEVDARGDQFSFCVALFEALYGCPPFASTSLTEYEEALRREVVPPPRPRGVSARTHDAIMRGLRIDPSMRWPSMKELVAKLQPTSAAPRRGRVAAAVVAAAIAGAAGVFGYSSRNHGSAPPLSWKTLKQRQLTFVGNVLSSTLSPDGRWVAYVSGDALIIQDLATSAERRVTSPGSVDLLDWMPDSSAIKLNVVSETTGAESSWLISPDGRRQRVASTFMPGHHSPNGDFARLSPSKRAIDIERDGTVMRSLQVPGTYSDLWVEDWSQDGRHLLISRVRSNEQWTLAIVTSDGHGPFEIVSEQSSVWRGNGIGAKFVQHDHAIVYPRSKRGGGHELVYVPLEDGQRSGNARVIIGAWPSPWFDISRDGARAVIMEQDSNVGIAIADIDRPESAAPTVRWRDLVNDVTGKRAPRFSPDGKLVAYISHHDDRSTVYIIPVEGGVPRQIGPTSGWGLDIAWSPDGRELALLDASVPSLVVVAIADGQARRLPLSQQLDTSLGDGRLFWAPGANIAYRLAGGRNWALLDPATGTEHSLLPRDDPDGMLYDLIASPDGTQMATYCDPPTSTAETAAVMKLITLDGGERILARSPLVAIGWSPDGKSIYAADLSERAVFRVPVGGGTPKPWISREGTRNTYGCRVAADARHVACTLAARVDLWALDDFERLLPSR